MSFGLTVAAAVFLLVWPVYSGFSGDRPTQATLLQINGSWVIIPVMFPVLVALVPLVARRQAVRIVAAIVMGGFVLISGFSFGMFYLPAGILMLLAACVEDSARSGIFGVVADGGPVQCTVGQGCISDSWPVDHDCPLAGPEMVLLLCHASLRSFRASFTRKPKGSSLQDNPLPS
jgi:hypothetical protein